MTVSEKLKTPLPNELKTVQIFAKMQMSESGEFTISDKSIKEVLFVEELTHETYPFKPQLIGFGATTYILTNPLSCTVDFEDGMYIIQNQEFDITVWGKDRGEAETAFAFSFHSLYENFALENDDKLSKEAKSLKINILKAIKNVINET